MGDENAAAETMRYGEKALGILKDSFGYDEFRPGQRAIIDAVLEGRDCLGVMPTGAGKSLCYQIPALLLDGITVVISPLVSLMHDQVSALLELGIPAAYLNSQLTPYEQAEVVERALAGEFKLLYIAPERFDDPRFRDFSRTADISLVAVDEAHCVSQWGQDFRPSYLQVKEFVASLPARPVVAAFTATATQRVADDVVRLLDLRDPLRLTTGFDRPNLRFEVENVSNKHKTDRLAEFISQHAGESGIVYCSKRSLVEEVEAELSARGISATRYHAGLTPVEREFNQRAFVNDDSLVMVATNAFGMGIDKSDVRYVVHYNLPQSLEAYYQEAGRAGRDGDPAVCLLMWNDSDVSFCRFLIEQDSSNEVLTMEELGVVRSSQRRRLALMMGYCLTPDCLRDAILTYFGEPSSGGGCANCSNCTDQPETEDVTALARAVMRCVHELRGRFGKGVVADVLRGANSTQVLSYGLQDARTFGAVDESSAQVKEVIELLAAAGYLEISEGRYPVVGLGPRAREAATDEFRLYAKKRVTAGRGASQRRGTKAKAVGALETDEQRELFERLRKLRKSIADSQGVPPYVVFSDAALRGMCVARPATDEEFLAVSGIGQVKLQRYGREFMAEIAKAG